MLPVESYFTTLTKKGVDATRSAEAILQLRVESKERVDELVDKALAVGCPRWNDTNDQGFLYGRSFRDLDGHHWDVFTVDLAAVQERASFLPRRRSLASLQHGQGGRYAAFSSQGLIHRFRR
jgi:hypothetical protein